MKRVIGLVGVVLLLALSAARAAHEDAAEHAKHPARTVILDNQDVYPSTVTLDQGDVLVFENYASGLMQVAFTEPADLKDKIRCGLAKGKSTDKGETPWQLFAWEGGRLVGTIPPGRFASVCSFETGTYTFLVRRQGARASGPRSLLAVKGQVVVK